MENPPFFDYGKGRQHFLLSPLDYPPARTVGAVNGGRSHLLAVDWLGWVCYKLHSLWINRTPKNNPCTYEVTNQ